MKTWKQFKLMVLIAIFVIVIIACDPDGGGGGGGGDAPPSSQTPAGWVKGITELKMDSATTTSITVSFLPANAGQSVTLDYELWYVEGSFTLAQLQAMDRDAFDIIDLGNSPTLTSGRIVETISGLEVNTNYSFAAVAINYAGDEDDYAVSVLVAKTNAETPPPSGNSYVLTVTGLPEDILLAALTIGSNPAPVATGFFVNNVATFYVPASPTMPIPTTTPWNTPGNYTLMLIGGDLLEIMADFGNAELHAYIGAETYTVSGNSATIAYQGNFIFIGGMPGEEGYELTINNLNEDVFGIVVMDFTQNPVAIGLSLSGPPNIFSFYDLDEMTPDFENPWLESGMFVLMAIDAMYQPLGFAQHTFSGESGSINWAEFHAPR